MPANFDFPKATLKEGLRLWLRGLTTSTDCKQRVRPFRRSTMEGLPGKKIRTKFKLQWKALFLYLEKHVPTSLPRETAHMTTEEIESYYRECVQVLKDRVSYCFANVDPSGWSTSTWVNRISRSSILKLGTEVDRSYLEEASYRNQPRVGVTRKRQLLEAPKYPGRQNRRQKQLSAGRDLLARETRLIPVGNEQEERSFAEAFPLVEMDDEMIARGKESFAEAERINRAELEGEATARASSARHAEVFVSPFDPQRQVQRNYGGDISGFSREAYGEILAPAIDGSGTGHRLCAIAGCTRNDLTPSRSCYRNGCTKLVHNLCAGEQFVWQRQRIAYVLHRSVQR